MNLKTLMDKTHKAFNNKFSRVEEIEKITRKVLDETKTDMIEMKEQELRVLRLKSKIFKCLQDYEEDKQANKITKNV